MSSELAHSGLHLGVVTAVAFALGGNGDGLRVPLLRQGGQTPGSSEFVQLIYNEERCIGLPCLNAVP